jgi:hypothetical protein
MCIALEQAILAQPISQSHDERGAALAEELLRDLVREFDRDIKGAASVEPGQTRSILFDHISGASSTLKWFADRDYWIVTVTQNDSGFWLGIGATIVAPTTTAVYTQFVCNDLTGVTGGFAIVNMRAKLRAGETLVSLKNNANAGRQLVILEYA